MSELKACIEELERHQKSLERKQLYPAALAMQGAIEIVKRHFPRAPRSQGVGKEELKLYLHNIKQSIAELEHLLSPESGAVKGEQTKETR